MDGISSIWVGYGWIMDQIWVEYGWNMGVIWVGYGWNEVDGMISIVKMENLRFSKPIF